MQCDAVRLLLSDQLRRPGVLPAQHLCHSLCYSSGAGLSISLETPIGVRCTPYQTCLTLHCLCACSSVLCFGETLSSWVWCESSIAHCPNLQQLSRLCLQGLPHVQGVCKSGVCVCQPGYRGSYCEISPACSGILDQAGNCCATGVVSQNGTCCRQVATTSLMPRPTCLIWPSALEYTEHCALVDCWCVRASRDPASGQAYVLTSLTNWAQYGPAKVLHCTGSTSRAEAD